ncbi:hypothetical protein HGRIS_001386 [Hohenbuehelia grisea]|uniref:Uncharacterized protein n=1 Tax=Hohenbuehelia grisea TaxID=104357 RepID=A0ABR3JQJ0_9AGAR
MPPTSRAYADYNVLSELADVSEAALIEKLQASLAFCHSWMYNRRRLEAHTYPAWDQIMASFAALDPSLVDAPQFPIYTLSPSGVDPDESFRTVADGDAKNGSPDYALLCLRYRRKQGADIPEYKVLSRGKEPLPLGNLPWTTLPRWDELVVDYVGIPLFAELKKFPSRTHIDGKRFFEELRDLLKNAMSQLEDYAKILFSDPLRRNQDSVVLVAAVGEWWRWRVMHRNETGLERPEKPVPVELTEDIDDSEEEEEEDEEEQGGADVDWSPDAEKKKKTTKTKRTKLNKVQQRAIKQAEKDKHIVEARVKKWREQRKAGGDDPTPLRFLDQEDLGDVVKNIENVLPVGQLWSGLLFLGSAASNQRMWYLRNRLASIVAH